MNRRSCLNCSTSNPLERVGFPHLLRHGLSGLLHLTPEWHSFVSNFLPPWPMAWLAGGEQPQVATWPPCPEKTLHSQFAMGAAADPWSSQPMTLPRMQPKQTAEDDSVIRRIIEWDSPSPSSTGSSLSPSPPSSSSSSSPD